MRHPRLSTAAIVLAVLASAESRASARDGISLLTPYNETLTRTSGAPTDVSRTFTVPTTSGQWFLTVESSGVTSADVKLNGAAVWGPSSFKQGVSLLRANVAVGASNTIEVRLSGKPGESLHVHLDGIVNDAAIPAQQIRHVFQRAFFTQMFTTASTDSVTLPTTEGIFWLDVQNGTPQGSNRANDATVALNGLTIFDKKDFNGQTASLSAPVLPAATNTIAVSGISPAGASVTVVLRGYAVDTGPPSLSIDEPADGVWHRLAGSVRASYSDGVSGIDLSSGSPNIMIGGTDVSSRFVCTAVTASASFASLSPPLHEGDNTLSVTVYDVAANGTTKTIHALVDSRPPVIAATFRPRSANFTNANPRFDVSITDPLPGSGPNLATFRAHLDGQDVTGDFLFSGTSASAVRGPLASGAHVLMISVVDVAGNSSQESVTFTVDDVPPAMVVTPGDGAVVRPTQAVAIMLSDAGSGVASVQAELDGQDVTARLPLTGGTAAGTLTMSVGDHVLRLVAFDNVRNRTEQTLHWTAKFPLPVVSVTPADGQSTNDTLPTILVQHSDPDGPGVDLASVKLFLDGQPVNPIAQVASTTAFVPAAPLNEGRHTLRVEVSDLVGTKATLDTTFRVDLVATHFSLAIAPADPSSVLVNSLNDLTIRALTASNQPATKFTGDITVTTTDGLATLDSLFASMTVADEGLLVVHNLAIVRREGALTITAVAIASPSVRGTLDVQGRAIVPSFTASAVGGDGVTTLTVQTVPDGTVQVYVDGVAVGGPLRVGAAGTLTTTLLLQPGPHRIQIVATGPDGSDAGRSAFATLGPPVSVSGVVFDGSSANVAPLSGVTASIEGTSIVALTDSAGRFTLPNVPLGVRVLALNGTNLPTSFGLTRIGLTLTSSTTVPAVVLKPIDFTRGTAIPISGSGAIPTLVATNPAIPNARVQVPAGVVTLPSVPVRPVLTISRVDLVDLPLRPPEALASSLFVSVGPEGAKFSNGVRLTLPNGDGIPPGQTTNVWHYSPETNRWEIVAQATASADGTVLIDDERDSGIFAMQAPYGLVTRLSIMVSDPTGASAASLGDQVLLNGTALQSDGGPLGPGGPNLVTYVTPSLPFAVSIRATRFFQDGTVVSVSLPFTIDSNLINSQNALNGRGWVKEIRVGHPATVTGTVVSAKNGQPVRNAQVFSNGASATTDYQGRFKLSNVAVWSPDRNVGTFGVFATKFVGASFTGSRTAPSATALATNTCDVGTFTVNADLFQGGPHLTTDTVASFNGESVGTQVASLLHHPTTNRFYTENLSGFDAILEIDPATNGWSTISQTFGQGGLQINNMALAPDVTLVKNDAIDAGARIWVTEGHEGTVFLVGVDRGTGNFGQKAAIGTTLNPNWVHQVAVDPLADTTNSFGGNVLVQFGTTWWMVDTLNGAALLGNANQQGVGLTHDAISQFYIAAADRAAIVLFHPEILPNGPTGPQDSMQTVNFANPLTFSPQQLTLMTSGTYFAGIVADIPVPGFAKPAGSSVKIIRKADGAAVEVYRVPAGSQMKVFGIAWGPGSGDNPLYVLQSNITEALTSGVGTPVRVELLRVQSVGGWAQAYAPPIQDRDGDGLPDDLETAFGFNPSSAHSDGGAGFLDDFWKLVNMGLDPNRRDTDGDGLADADEVALGTDPSGFTFVSIGRASVLMAPNTSFNFTGSVSAPGLRPGTSVTSFATINLVTSNPGVFTFGTPSGPVTTLNGYTGGPVTLLGNGLGQAFIFVVVNGVAYPVTTVSVQTDTIEPAIALNIADGSMSCDVFPEIVLSYTDPAPASGVATNALSVTLDGSTLLRVDENPGSSTYYPDAPLAAGVHTITATVPDNVGNTASLTRSFTVMRVTGGTLLTTTRPEPQNNAAVAGGSVVLSNGQFLMSRVDLMVPGRGDASFLFARTYRSYVQSDGAMGPGGWTHNYDMRVKRCDATTIQWLTGSGRIEEFQQRPDGSYASPVGFFARLLGDETGFVIREPHGLKYVFKSLSDPIAPGCLAFIQDRHANKLTFTYGNTAQSFGKIVSVSDPYDRVYTYGYDLAGRLFTVQDFSGRVVTLRYSASGDLVKVTSPTVIETTKKTPIIPENQFPAGRSEVYGYTSGNADIRLNHKLVVALAPNEAAGVTDAQLLDLAFLRTKARLENTWDLDPFSGTAGRVLSQRVGGTNATGVTAGGTFTFSYQKVLPAGVDPVNDEVLKVTVVDPRGNVSEGFLNAAGQCVRDRRYTRGIRGSDPPFFESMRRFNGDGLTTLAQPPLGARIVFGYDSGSVNRSSQANLLSRAIFPDSRGDSQGGTAPRIVTFTYEPIYNMMRTFTEERGYNPLPGPIQPPVVGAPPTFDYVVQNDPANARGISQIARYTTTRYFDYQQANTPINPVTALAREVGLSSTVVSNLLASAGVALAQGNLNQDSSDELFGFGDVVKIVAPAVTLDPLQRRASAAAFGSVQQIETLTVHNKYGQPTKVTDAERNVHTVVYYPSNDPDGDGVVDNAQSDPTGGYPSVVTRDVQLDPARESGTNPAPTNITVKTFYDSVGNPVGVLDSRGIRHVRDVNSLNETVRTLAATDTSGAYLPRDRALPALSYEALLIHDANGNVVESRLGNQGERDGTSAFVASNPYWCTKARFDILDAPLAVIREVTPIANDASITESSPGVTVTRFAYDPNENLALVTKPEGNTVAFTRDERDLPFMTVRGPGTASESIVTRSYDANGNLETVVDGAKNNPGKNVSVTAGDLARVVRDGFDRPVQIFDAENQTTRILYDPAGHPVRTVRYGSPEEGSPRLAEVLQYWDEAGRLFRTAALAFRYDTPGSTGRPFDLATPSLGATPPPGEKFAISEVDLDALGRAIRHVDMKGDESLVDFDGAGRVLRSQSPLFGPAFSYPGSSSVRNSADNTYDGAGNLIHSVAHRRSPLATVPGAGVNNVDVIDDRVVDALGRTVRVTDAMTFTTRFYYDSRSNLIARTDPRSATTVVDPLNLRGPGPSTINGDGNVVRMFYDGLSRCTRTEALLKVNGVGDGDPNLTANTNLDTSNPAIPSGIVVTQTAFDRNSRVQSRTDSNGGVTSFAFDELDRATREIFANGTFTTRDFDADDNLVQTVDPNGSVIQRTYDGLGRPVRLDVTRRATNLAGTGQDVLGTTLQAFEWDGLSRMRAAIDDNGAATTLGVATDRVFDSLSRLLDEQHRINASVAANNVATTSGRLSVTGGGATIDRTVKSDYQAPAGFSPSTLNVLPVMPVRTSLTYPGLPASAATLTFGIDGLDRIQTISAFGASSLITTSYDFLGGNVVQRELPGVSMRIVYDEDCGCPHEIVCQQTTGTGAVVAEFKYDYDGNYNRIFEQRVEQSGSPKTNFSYDSLNRVTGASFGVVGALPPTATASYQFDGVSNFVQKTESGQTSRFNGGPASYAPDSLNRYTNVQTFLGAALTGTDAPIHDAAGARIKQQDKKLYFDALERLVRVDRLVGGTFLTVGQYTYDAMNRRVTKRADVRDSSGAVVRQDNLAFICDGPQEIEELDLSSQAILATYVFGSSDVDEVLLMLRGSTSVAFSADAQRSVVVATDTATGTPVERYDYSGALYGKHVVTSGTGAPRMLAQEIGNPYRFQGRRFDDESGLYHFRNRYLDPEEGRFVNRDPKGIWGDSGNLGNGYAFCGGNPVNRRDPFGLESDEEAWAKLGLKPFAAPQSPSAPAFMPKYGNAMKHHPGGSGPSKQLAEEWNEVKAHAASTLATVHGFVYAVAGDALMVGTDPSNHSWWEDDNNVYGFKWGVYAGHWVMQKVGFVETAVALIGWYTGATAFAVGTALDTTLIGAALGVVAQGVGVLTVAVTGAVGAHGVLVMTMAGEGLAMGAPIPPSGGGPFKKPDFYKEYEGGGRIWGELNDDGSVDFRYDRNDCPTTGSQMFNDMLDGFGREKVKTINGSWTSGANFNKFVEAVIDGATVEQAAALTPTGKSAIAAGYKTIKVDIPKNGQFGATISVHFSK